MELNLPNICEDILFMPTFLQIHLATWIRTHDIVPAPGTNMYSLRHQRTLLLKNAELNKYIPKQFYSLYC